MNLKEYQELSMRTLNHDLGSADQVLNMLLGISGETGEVIDHFKKHFYQGHELDINNVAEEIGDIMFYIANLCNLYDLELEDIIENNYMKLLKRFPSGFDKNKSINREG